MTHQLLSFATTQVKSSDAAILEVVPVSKVAGVHQYQARLLQPIPIAVDSDAAASLAIVVTSAASQQHIRVPVQSAAALDEAALGDTLTAGQCAGRAAPGAAAAAAAAASAYSTSSVLVSVVSNMGLIVSVLIALAVVIYGKLEQRIATCRWRLSSGRTAS